MVLAHAAADASTLPLWLQWNLDPLLVLGLALFTGAYFYALGPLRRKYGWADSVDRGKVAYFAAGTAILALALLSPLDTLGDEYLFSAHMVQHMLIAVVVPPLWLLGTPEWMLAPLFRRPGVTRVMRWLTHPIVAFGLFNGLLWLWHAPALYDATLENEYIHILEHLLFIASGVLFWWPVIGPVRQIPRMSRAFGVLYLFLACQPMVALGALLTFSAHPLYAPYVTAPRIWGSTPLGDQQLGGLIMWLPTNIPFVIGLSILFFQWVSEHDRAERAAAGELDDPAETTDTLSPAGSSSSPAPSD
jgi:cytochrome c oxidase assembly factor CtaG